MNKKTIKIIVNVSIILFFILLMGLLFYTIFYNKETNCNERLQLKNFGNCSEECKNTCIERGFNPDLNHTSLGETMSVSKSNNGLVKESYCLCECVGCKE